MAMATSAGYPLSLHENIYQKENDVPILLLSDSEDDETPPTPRVAPEPRSKSSMSMTDDDMKQKTKDAAANIPQHPITAMQGPFTESLMEATVGEEAGQKPKLRYADAKERRARLLEGQKDDDLYVSTWRFRPGHKHHELWKLMAQVSFGVYLLLNGIANSNTQVVNILQGHIDEVDEFLETTLEDVKLAAADVKERIDFLKLPTDNLETFEKMLEDRNFRLQIVTGNEKIEHIISRTTTALEATLEDVDEGLRATREFAVYLSGQQNQPWRYSRPDVIDIFDAMKGNAEGWYKAFLDLQECASGLDALLVQLAQIVVDMDRRAGEVSRRTRFSVAPYSDPSNSPKTSFRSGSVSSSGQRSHTESERYSTMSPAARSQATSPTSGPILETLPSSQYQPPGKAANQESPFSDDHALESPILQEPSRPAPIEEEDGLYILQPRTYTPVQNSPLPSPRLQEPLSPQIVEIVEPIQVQTARRQPLRQRLSLKGSNPPVSIQVPPPRVIEFENPRYSSPRTPRTYQTTDSAYASDIENRPATAHRSTAGTPHRFSPPTMPNTIPSPRSDQQYFRPVQASPHSPLQQQQRPWTAGTNRPSHHRNQPSAMGMSMLSNVTTVTYDNEKKLKKKKSAFGWLKKAFTLDEEEKAAFEARKMQQQANNPYYEGRSPQFLDGRRRETYVRR